MKINNISLAFCSKIKFVPGHEFYKYTASMFNRDYDGLSVDEVGTPCKQDYTYSAANCTAGGVQNGKELVMFHFEKTDESKINELAARIKEISDKGGNLKGFLTGGRLEKESEAVFRRVKRLFDDLKIKTSIFWGQKGDCDSSVCYSVDEDSWVVYTDPNNKGREIRKPEDIRTVFQKRNLSEEDELWIHGRKIDKKELN